MDLSRRAQPITVSLVDGQRMFLDGLAAWLSSIPQQFRVVSATADTDEMRRNANFPPDVAVLDVEMPDGSLDSTITSLVAQGVIVVIITGTPDGFTERRVLDAGAAAYISKNERAGVVSHAILAATQAAGDALFPWDGSMRQVVSAERPPLSIQERRVMQLYSTGMMMKSVAYQMGISQDTVRTYIKRIRAKYSALGIQLDTKVDFYRMVSSE